MTAVGHVLEPVLVGRDPCCDADVGLWIGEMTLEEVGAWLAALTTC